MKETIHSGLPRLPAWTYYAITAVLAYWPLFLHLSGHPIYIWDESRLAGNATEMYYNGDWLVMKYGGSPDLWNTKPPLVIWMQLLSMHIFGVNELGLRMPSAVMALVALMLMVWFSIRILKNGWIGMFAALFAVTSQGFTDFHLARSGDFDAVVNAFLVGYALFFFCWLQEKRRRWLLAFYVCLVLAVMSKSVTGIFFLPGIFLYLLLTKQLLLVMRDRKIWIGVFSAFIIIAGFYLLRERAAPGYITAVWNNEIGGRFGTTLEGHDLPWFIYLQFLLDWLLPTAFVTMLVGLVWNFPGMSNVMKQFKWYLVIISAILITALSLAGTKLVHYVSPVVPLLCFIAAYGLYGLTSAIRWSWESKKARSIALSLFLVAVFGIPMQRIIKYVTNIHTTHTWDKDFYALSRMLQDALYHDNGWLRNYNLVWRDYSPHFEFYIRELKRKGYPIEHINETQIQPGQLIAVDDDQRKSFIESHFNIESMGDYGVVKLYRIISAK